MTQRIVLEWRFIISVIFWSLITGAWTFSWAGDPQTQAVLSQVKMTPKKFLENALVKGQASSSRTADVAIKSDTTTVMFVCL